jgi:RHS repeat-associated protein
MDPLTGLTNMQQRYYDQGVGRFLSVDPVSASSINGGNFNRYWYANSNPYKFIDPDGRFFQSIFGPPSPTSPYRSIEGADRGDEEMVMLVAAPAAAGAGAAAIVTLPATAPLVIATVKVTKSKAVRRAAKEIFCAAITLSCGADKDPPKDIADRIPETQRGEQADALRKLIEERLRRNNGEQPGPPLPPRPIPDPKPKLSVQAPLLDRQCLRMGRC